MIHIRAFPILGAITVATLTAGCSTTSPGVTYYDVSTLSKTTSQKGMSDVFVLDKATLKVSFPAGSKPKNPDSKTSSDTTPQSNSAAASDGNAKATKPAEASKAQVKVELEISEDSSRRIGIAGTNDYRKTTMVNLTKRENTDMVKSVGVATTENLKNSITKIGALLTGFVTVSSAGSCSDTSIDIDTKGNPNEISGTSDGSCIKYKIGKLPGDAIKSSDIPWGTEVPYFYYAACRSVDVTINVQGATSETLKFKMPDPHFVQAVQIPFKGSIQKHSTCGVSTVTEGTASPTASIEALTELITQINAIKDARDKN